MKEGRANSSRIVDSTFDGNFVIKGLPSSDSINNGADGWSIPSTEVIDTFLGGDLGNIGHRRLGHA